MTAPTRPPRAQQPYPVAETPEPESTDGGWVSVLVAAVVAAVAIAVAGVIAGLVVVNLRESAMSEAPPSTSVAAAPTAQNPAPILPALTTVPPVRTTAPAAATTAPTASSSAAATSNTAAATELDRAAVQRGVTTVLTDSYGISDVRDVRCPASIEIVPGASYDCSVRVGAAAQTVSVTITDLDGTYEVSRPY
ncbi:DUF4333 domain-containing protein [Nocardia farcinica]|uniref:DUF4333 domain-containing protein n=1 Tax=Nocardia farcinica TaxID=37329 RepID=UPI0018932244|nr:DUF4333 domain-containing protein [Nocardia farcinica]MBF6257433.1 DUF4333 domain-containing protein [Nocardia farcinica]MBF6266132.1 DUF4333 domain-containing protein [Nocardia farcinica]MBF6417953.1 DUF4333 domain-containing protein [Nocardia farcinica]MBF6429430.1 DUF4333 domain-containing protein [Nocardia farcinica]MBF6443169.1 DUF4333 domain-containing protein [Nocardia farcinica]